VSRQYLDLLYVALHNLERVWSSGLLLFIS